MNIVVCLKQVPDTAHLKFDSNDQLAADGIENVMNPFCEYAIETAIRLKEAHEGSKLTAICMGPAPAKEVLKRAIAMGADEAFLLSDNAFSGADGWATGYTLCTAIKKLVPDFNLVILGQFATDGMTGITGPAMAEFLDVPSITFSKKIELKDANTITVHRETEKGTEVYEMSMPGVVCMMKCDYEARIPSIKGVMKANRTEIPTVDLAGLGLTVEQVGAKGSTTTVDSVWRKPKKHGGVKVDGSDPQQAVGQLIAFLREQKIM
jgi:electron transfer flavoprotein alpha/beta subunit